MIEKSRPLRSRKHLMVVASLPCANCSREGSIQAAHTNFGKGMAIKACDSQTFPLCFTCHAWLDQSGSLSKEERRISEAGFVLKTRELLLSRCLWPNRVEDAFIRANKYKEDVCAQQ